MDYSDSLRWVLFVTNIHMGHMAASSKKLILDSI